MENHQATDNSEDRNKDKPTYVTVYHRARRKLELNIMEYCIADTIYVLAANPTSEFPGWCYVSKEHLADCLGISQRTVFNCLVKLLKIGLIEKSPADPRFLRTSLEWYNTVKVDKEDLNKARTARSADTMQDLHTKTAKSAYHGTAKNAHNNNSTYNNSNNKEDYLKKVQDFFSLLDTAWLEEVKKAFPQINLTAELNKMKAWLISNPDKPKKNIKRFAVNWLGRINSEVSRKPAEDQKHSSLGAAGRVLN